MIRIWSRLSLGPERMRYDAADAKRLGCTGLLGIHWRTKIMSPNVAALADAAWDQSSARSDFAAIRQKTQELRTGAVGGSVSHFTEPVQGTDEAAVYQSVRYNLDSYTLAVPNGKYSVTLKFNEPFYSEAGKRVFSVDIQGRRVIDDLDIFAKAGKNRALDFNFPDIAVTDGTVNIGFVKKIDIRALPGSSSTAAAMPAGHSGEQSTAVESATRITEPMPSSPSAKWIAATCLSRLSISTTRAQTSEPTLLIPSAKSSQR